MPALLFRHLVDDALEDDDLNMDVACYVGYELDDVVADGGGGEADDVAAGRSGSVGFAARDVKVADLVAHGEPHQVGIIQHAVPAVALCPEHLICRMQDPARDFRFGHAVIVRILVGDRWDEKGAEELADQVLGVADAYIAPKPRHTRAIGGMRVLPHRVRGHAQDGEGVEGVDDVACGQPGLVFGVSGRSWGPLTNRS